MLALRLRTHFLIYVVMLELVVLINKDYEVNTCVNKAQLVNVFHMGSLLETIAHHGSDTF